MTKANLSKSYRELRSGVLCVLRPVFGAASVSRLFALAVPAVG
jgi:hypothetical protein